MTGLDISPTALITAEQRAKDAGVDVKFAVADSTKLDGYTDAFDTVIDSGLFHSLDDDGRRRYAAAVHRATRPGATLLLSCFSDANPVGRGVAATGGVRRDAARRPRRRRLGHRVPGGRHGAWRTGRRPAGRNGILVPPCATALSLSLSLDDHGADLSGAVDVLDRVGDLIERVGAGNVEFCG